MEPDLNGFAENYRTLFGLKKRNIREYSAMGFAYIGDAVYELAVRTYVVEHYNAPVQKMHRITSSLVKAQTQAAVADAIMDELTPQEADAYRRGRNSDTHTRSRNADMIDYRRATGLEARGGYLYLNGEYERLVTLIHSGLDKLSLLAPEK